MSNDNGNGSKDDLKGSKANAKPESPDDVINQLTLMEIVIKRHRDNSETMQLICQENLMVNHKQFLIKKLLTAIEIVMSATAKNKNKIVIGNNNLINRLKNRTKGMFSGK